VRLLPTLTSFLPVFPTLSGPSRTFGRALVLPGVSPLSNVGSPGIIRRGSIGRRTVSVYLDTVARTLQATGDVARRLLMSSRHTASPVINLDGHHVTHRSIRRRTPLITSSLADLAPVDLDLGALNNALGTCKHAPGATSNDSPRRLDGTGCTRPVKGGGCC
jgi:hypothetical protein